MVIIKFEERFIDSRIDLDRKFTRDGKFIYLEVDPGVSTAEIIESCGLKFTQPMAILINDTTSDLARILQSGDQVRLLPQIAGGAF